MGDEGAALEGLPVGFFVGVYVVGVRVGDIEGIVGIKVGDVLGNM